MGRKKQTRRKQKKKRSKQLSKTFERDSQPDQIQREQPGCRARTGQTTFSTLQGACNFYRRDASRRCFGGKLKLRLTLSSLETWLRRVARVAKLSHRSRERRKERKRKRERDTIMSKDRGRLGRDGSDERAEEEEAGVGGVEEKKTRTRREDERRGRKIRGGGLENTDHGETSAEAKCEKEKKGRQRQKRREKEREGEGKRERNQRWERPAEPTPTRTNCFTGKSFAVLISRHDSFRNRVVRWERNGEILESSPKSSSHVSRSTGRPDVARISLSLLPPPLLLWVPQRDGIESDVTDDTLGHCWSKRAPADSWHFKISRTSMQSAGHVMQSRWCKNDDDKANARRCKSMYVLLNARETI